jgi:hypothetical protein
VDVEVEYGLPGAGADVEDGAVSLLDFALAGDVRGCDLAAADEFGVGSLGFFQSSKMFPGNDEYVRGSLWLDVFESEDVFVLVNFFRGDFAAENATEETGSSGISHRKQKSGLKAPVKETIALDTAECQ